MKLLQDIQLKSGAHATPDDGMCAMEAVAWYMEETHTDHPQCVSPAIAAAMRVYNDWLPDAKRDSILKPLLLEVIGTNTTLDDEVTRAQISAQFAKYAAESAKSAKYAKYAAESAEYAAEYAAKYAAEYAKYAAEYAAESAKYAAEYAKYAAEYAKYAAKYAAESAEYAAEYATIDMLIGQHIMDMCKVGK